MFSNNEATNGSALYIKFNLGTRNNKVTIEDTIFQGNKALDSGGALFATLVFPNNNLSVTRSTFCNNSAKSNGGAVFINSDKKNGEISNIVFNQCKWIGNVARSGAALIAKPLQNPYFGHVDFPSITLRDCDFYSNRAKRSTDIMENHVYEEKGKGVVASIGFNIVLTGEIHFNSNVGGAIHLKSCVVTIHHSTSHFFQNRNFRGGAISMAIHHKSPLPIAQFSF